MTIAFLVGLMIIESIEGRLPTTDPAKQKKSKVCLANRDYHLKRMSDIHQKLGTFNWYNPLCTGKIAVSTDDRV